MPLFGRKKKVDEVVVVEPQETLPQPPAAADDGLRSMEDHRDYLLSLVEPLPPFGMSLMDAWDLALCEDIVADADLPRFDNAQVDGYAVRAADVASATQGEPITLGVAASVTAGQDLDHELQQGTAVRITNGAPLPAGADAVVPMAFTDQGRDQVKVLEPVVVGEYVRGIATDVAAGDLLMTKGQRVDARTIGLLAGAGFDKVLARPRPRVVVVSTGAELVEPGRALKRPSQIHDASGFLVAAAAKAAGAQVFRVAAYSDDPDTVRDVINDQLIRADLVVNVGGVSSGEHDVIRELMPQLGMTDFARVAMIPGQPQGFGLIGEDRVPMVMLPGHPVSAYASFEAFALPVIRKLMGVDPVTPASVRCVVETVLRSPAKKLQLVPAVVRDDNGRRLVRPVGGSDATLLGELAKANALVLLPVGTDIVKGGESVHCWLLDHD